MDAHASLFRRRFYEDEKKFYYIDFCRNEKEKNVMTERKCLMKCEDKILKKLVFFVKKVPTVE